PRALALWSKFTRLSEPRWCFSDAEAEKEGLTESFAMIRLNDQAVVINLAQIEAAHLERFALEILAHEIGHHVYAPADLTDNARAGGMPQGLTEMDPGERESATHPALDPELSGLPRQGQEGPPKETGMQGGSPGQYREPFEYGEILKALGLDLSPLEAAVRYY